MLRSSPRLNVRPAIGKCLYARLTERRPRSQCTRYLTLAVHDIRVDQRTRYVSTSPGHYLFSHQVATVPRLDDEIIFSASAEQHGTDVDMVLTCLREAGVTLNFDKCTWFSDEFEYL